MGICLFGLGDLCWLHEQFVLLLWEDFGSAWTSTGGWNISLELILFLLLSCFLISSAIHWLDSPVSVTGLLISADTPIPSRLQRCTFLGCGLCQYSFCCAVPSLAHRCNGPVRVPCSCCAAIWGTECYGFHGQPGRTGSGAPASCEFSTTGLICLLTAGSCGGKYT